MSALDESDANRVSYEVHAKSTGFQTQRGLHNLRSSYSRLLTPRRVFLLKLRIFTFLDHPIGLIQSSYHVTMLNGPNFRFFLMLTVYGLSILDTIKEIHDSVVWYVYAYMDCTYPEFPANYPIVSKRTAFRDSEHDVEGAPESQKSYCCGLLFIIFTASLVYMAEKNNSKSSISFLTIGYGDIVPSTAISKIIIVTLAMMGIGFVAGIIGSGFAIQAAHRSKKNKRRQTMKPAVSLIQHADSAVVKQDLKSVIRSSKIAETFLKACSLTSKNDVTEQPRVDQQFYFTISSSAEGDKIRSRLKQKLAKTNVGHKKHGVVVVMCRNIEHMKLDSMSLKPSHSVDTKAHSLASDTFSAPTCTLHQAQLKELHQKLDNLNHIVDNAIQKLTQQKK
ncbi:hypothetical protein RF11_00399 [Thelohanellus kitauei]|uniref:Potassium channel domain-containing protein n=1 Tax=Thelohanellus kitauei TaxID=669202 RepID=A0A0C2N6N0_THEKT|nr:hypothetical protein RF11_00399 [Thelohanellus kitauei]